MLRIYYDHTIQFNPDRYKIGGIYWFERELVPDWPPISSLSLPIIERKKPI